jgi:hypothetical protein
VRVVLKLYVRPNSSDMKLTLAVIPLVLCAACGGSGSGMPDENDPANVPFGTTAIVAVVNPTINDANSGQ